jgi:Ca2+-dependent lipid-binding protein
VCAGVLLQEVYDWDMTTKDDKLGWLEVPLSTLRHQKPISRWFRLTSPDDGENAGEIQLMLNMRYSL